MVESTVERCPCTMETIEERVLKVLRFEDWMHIYKEPFEDEEGKMVFTDATFLCRRNGKEMILKVSTGEGLKRLKSEIDLVGKSVKTPRVLVSGDLKAMRYACIEYDKGSIDIERFDDDRDSFGVIFFKKLFNEVTNYRKIPWPEERNEIRDLYFVYGFDEIEAGDERLYDIDKFMLHLCPEYGSEKYPKFEIKMVFSHGDLFYRNVLIDRTSRRFRCLIDWENSCLLPDFGEFYSYFYHFQMHGNLFEKSSLRWLSVFYTPSVEAASDVMEYFDRSLYWEGVGHLLTGKESVFMSFRRFREEHRRAYDFMKRWHYLLAFSGISRLQTNNT